MPELRRRVFAATLAPLRAAPQRVDDTRCSYISRIPPRNLSDPARVHLFQLLEDRLGTVSEVDFGKLPWPEQVFHSARLDVLIGVHGSGLTNLLWLPRHAFAIELFPSGAHAYDYQIMAEIAGISYFGVESAEEGHVYRDWTRMRWRGGDLNRTIHRLLERTICQVLDAIDARLANEP